MQGILTYLAALIAGSLLLDLSLKGTFLASFGPALNIIGVLTVIVFAAVLIYKGLRLLIGKG
ncbi:hypothetical protein [Alkalihalobacillus sp. AL-G]|uniref:hypothetical protein n=1 Tax=Alkalihalobacillus sp. AL-G TaxID=2926399 RepID=UPI002729A5C4|nr:hypothetical protein [Alkalihalobacillus sp. AL-G]WLD94691.1 hypothetical protein MOJ78_07355 [Alkalihalobacillus sp. AL-G]